MPGIKRKSGGIENSKQGNGKRAVTSKGDSSKARKKQLVAMTRDEESDVDDDFDDDEDLLGAALRGEGVSEGESSNEDEEDEDVEVEGDNVDMYSDEDLEGGIIEIDEDEKSDKEKKVSTPSSKPNGKQKSLYAIPSRDEMSQLKNTTELYKSNIFRLKIDEMLTEVRPKYEKSNALDYVLRHIKSRLESLSSIKSGSLNESLNALSKLYKGKVHCPFPDPAPKSDSPLKFAFEKPSKIQVAGSWILKSAALRPEGVDVDLILTMPSSLFQEKDHMNMRYFYKRAFYLGTIAAALSTDTSLNIDIAYGASEEDIRRPYLIVKSKKDGSQSDFSKLKAFIKIHLAHDTDLFAPGRLAPSRNSVRIDKDTQSEEQPATPHYNSAILADELYVQHLVYLNETIASCKEFSNAVILLKTWASQRALGSGLSKAEVKGRASAQSNRRIAFGSTNVRFLLTMILAHLLNGSDRSQPAASSSASVSRLSHGFSSYQLFRGVIDFLAHHDFQAQPVFMKGTEGIISRRDKISQQEFANHFPHVMVDPTGSINLLANMSEGSLRYLQREAKTTLSLLLNSGQDRFDEIFLQDRSKPSFYFDEVLSIKLNSIKATSRDKADYGSSVACAVDNLSKALSIGLTNRKTLVTVFGSSIATWALNSSRSSNTNTEIGINLDTAQAFRLVDHGPRPEDTKAAEEYKAFWGDLSELRRFRDGRIVESVVWNVKGPVQRLTIPRRIIQFVSKRHLGVELDEECFHSKAFESLNDPSDVLAARAYLTSPLEQGFQPATTIFDDLAKQLRDLKDLPLSIISVVPSDAALRSMSTMIPAAMNIYGQPPLSASYFPTMDFVITFESSGQWPDDLAAIQAMKMAFFESISAKLVNVLPSGSRAHVVMDHDADENKLWDKAALEVILASGYAFRGRIYHIREKVLLERILEDKNESTFRHSQARSALDRFTMRFTHSVRHHNHMSALVHRFPSLGDAIRITKRWINGQLFGNHIADELVELLVASIYIESSSISDNSAPGLGHLGFLQAVQKIAEWNWRETPLAVPMTSSTSATPSVTMDSNTLRLIETNFEQIRKMDAGIHHFAWFIATEEEPKGVCWARDTPSAGTADTLQRLAKAANEVLRAGPFLLPTDVKALFVPDLSHFDFIIELEPASVTRYIENNVFDPDALQQSQNRLEGNGAGGESGGESENRRNKYKNLSTLNQSSQTKGPLANFDSGSEFVQLIESIYLDSFRLFYDRQGGCFIGGMFNPILTTKERQFRVGLGFNSVPIAAATPNKEPSSSSKNVILNKPAILEEIQRIGVGIVRQVTLQAS